MSPIGSITNTNTSTSGAATTSSKPPAIDKNMFLQLMVAQLKNQDPMKPTDSTAFVGQLAQFQQLETSENSSQDIAALRLDADQLIASAAKTAAAKP